METYTKQELDNQIMYKIVDRDLSGALNSLRDVYTGDLTFTTGNEEINNILRNINQLVKDAAHKIESARGQLLDVRNGDY